MKSARSLIQLLSTLVIVSTWSALLYLPALVSAQCPNGIRIRPEWRDLPDREKQRFVSAINTLHRQRNGFNVFSSIHNQMQNAWHNGVHFFPAHRVMLLRFEEALRAIDPAIVFPYWDWGLDANDLTQSPVWQYFGRSQPGQCLNDGIFANWIVTSIDRHCLRRGMDFNRRQEGSTSQVISRMIQTSETYSEFHENIEYGPHALIHQVLGGDDGIGDMGSTISPNDPIFYIHHSMVDKLWNDWQRANPNNFNQINGIQSGSRATINDQIAFYNIRIRDVMNITNLCYVYANPGTNFNGDQQQTTSRRPPAPPTSSRPPAPPTSSRPPAPPTSSRPPAPPTSSNRPPTSSRPPTPLSSGTRGGAGTTTARSTATTTNANTSPDVEPSASNTMSRRRPTIITTANDVITTTLTRNGTATVIPIYSTGSRQRHTTPTNDHGNNSGTDSTRVRTRTRIRTHSAVYTSMIPVTLTNTNGEQYETQRPTPCTTFTVINHHDVDYDDDDDINDDDDDNDEGEGGEGDYVEHEPTATTTIITSPTDLPPKAPKLNKGFCIRMHYNLTLIYKIEANRERLYEEVIEKARKGEYVGGPGTSPNATAPADSVGHGILGGAGPYAKTNINGVDGFVVSPDKFRQIAQQLVPNYVNSLDFGTAGDKGQSPSSSGDKIRGSLFLFSPAALMAMAMILIA